MWNYPNKYNYTDINRTKEWLCHHLIIVWCANRGFFCLFQNIFMSWRNHFFGIIWKSSDNRIFLFCPCLLYSLYRNPQRSKNGKMVHLNMWVYIRGYKSKDYLKTQSTIIFLFFAYQRGLGSIFCCCWFLLLLRLLHYADFVDVWAHCAYIHILSLYNTNLLFECIRVRRENQCNFGASKDILARFEFDVCP